MGLDCSHRAFHGSYGAFNRFRQIVCASVYGSYPPHMRDLKNKPSLWGTEDVDDENWYVPDNFDNQPFSEGLRLFFCHSDCDGNFDTKECTKVADALEMILPRIVEMSVPSYGHIENAGGFEEVTKKFIKGCRLAVEKYEPLTFG